MDRYVRGGELANPLRVLLGDEKVAWIYLHPEATDAELAKYANLFPEATVQRREPAWRAYSRPVLRGR